MDSSRGGPLTTFIMMLPLIVVPTIAMLKPADGNGGLISDLLNAATGQSSAHPDEAASGGDAATLSDGTEVDAFEALFKDEAPEFRADQTAADTSRSGPGAGHAHSNAATPPGFEDPVLTSPGLSAAEMLDQFSEDVFQTDVPAAGGTNLPSTSQSAPPARLDAQTQGLLATLQKMGVTRQLWFSPDGRRSGFVAFIDAGQGVLRYRFEAVAASPAAAVSDVILQIEDWQRTTAN